MTGILAGGRYRLDRRLASGGMGEVWLGTDMALGRRVAVKLLHPSLSDDESFRARFQAEARHAAALHDPHIATVFDFGDDVGDEASHRSYLVMEYVDGQPLSALLRGPLPPEPVAELLAQAADALAVAHDAGIVHRDVKPANFMVTPDRHLKITDFGVARARGASSLTDTGTVIGTPAYVAPEVAEGREATPASDIYSLGVVLYECLAGRRPFGGDTPVAVALAHVRVAPPELPGSVPAPLRDLARRALAKDPAARPATARQFAAELRAAATGVPGPAAHPPATMPIPVALGGPTTTVLPAASTPSAPAPERRNRRGVAWPIVGAVVAIVLIIAAALAVSALSDDTDTPAADGQRGEGAAQNNPEVLPQPTGSDGAEAPSTAETQTVTSPPETTATEDAVTVNVDDYIGLPVKDAEKMLKDLGLHSVTEDVGGEGKHEVVADLDPTGEVAADTEVTLFVVKTEDPPQAEEGQGQGKGPEDDDDDDE